ncbi:hypothetical protein DFH09DRAFT_1276181 [Mycena vulgaris]|nr:hypothetical protein DFH09DRAFT_1276181 [Mycena vulgaris]
MSCSSWVAALMLWWGTRKMNTGMYCKKCNFHTGRYRPSNVGAIRVEVVGLSARRKLKISLNCEYKKRRRETPNISPRGGLSIRASEPQPASYKERWRTVCTTRLTSSSEMQFSLLSPLQVIWRVKRNFELLWKIKFEYVSTMDEKSLD